MKNTAIAIFFALFLSLNPVAHAEQVVIDQQTPQLTGIINAGEPNFVWQQEVEVGVSGRLVGIDILPRRLDSNPPSQPLRFFVNIGAPWQTDAHAYDQIIQVPTQPGGDWFFVDLSSLNLEFQAGDHFIWGTQGVEEGLFLRGFRLDPYPQGELWHSFFGNPPLPYSPVSGPIDFAFRTHMAVPEPSSATLYSCVAVLFASVRRTRARGL